MSEALNSSDRPAGLFPRAPLPSREGGDPNRDNFIDAEGRLLQVMLKALNGADINEIHSPERILKEAKKFGLDAGLAMDLLTGWDFDKRAD